MAKRRKIRKGRMALAAALGFGCVLALGTGVFFLARALWPAQEQTEDASAAQKGQPVSDKAQQPDSAAGKEGSVRVTATGDMLLEDGFVNWFQNGSWGDYMKDLQPWLGTDDWTIANLEVPIAGEELGLAGLDYCFNAPAETAENISENSIDFVSLANNHAMDRGAEGAERTLANLDARSIGHTGLFLEESDRDAVSISEVNGVRIAVLSWTYATNQPADTAWRVNIFSDPWSPQISVLLSDIEKAKKEADFVLVCMHWGTEFTYSLNESQIQIGQQIADAGADVILGNHPHTIQPAAWLTGRDGNRTLCFYSLGNLISSAYTVSRADETFQNMYEVGALAQFTLQKKEDGTTEVVSPEIIPIVNHFEAEYENFRLLPLKDYTEAQAARHSQAGWSDSFTADWLKAQVKQVFARSGIPVDLD